jgi:bifunctional non-homologous end joining protein LigD
MNVTVDGRRVRVTNLDRVLWPATGTTKADLLAHYTTVAPVMLPHLRDHPITLHRLPEGVTGPHFFQTRAPAHPDWVRAVTLRSPTGKVFDVVVIDSVAGLVWAANIAAIELHPYLGTAERFTQPTQLVFDLDPGAPAGLVECSRVALTLRALLDDLDLVSMPKASGGKGIHIHVPVDDATFDETKLFARATAELVAARCPDLVVTRMAKAERAGRVFID